MKVYVVTSGSYSDYGIDAMFSTRELAEQFIAEGKKAKFPDNDFNDIEEWDVDVRAGEVVRTQWSVTIDLKTSWMTDPYEREVMEQPHLRSLPTLDRGNTLIDAFSFVSADHARKLAVEARQEWLRTHK